jgi:hypothetical protein
MARYYPVSPLFWSDEKVLTWSGDTRLLALYLLTCEHRNLEGLYRLPYAYIEADLDWDSTDVWKRMDHLISQDFVRYDEDARVVLLPKALRYHEPKSDPQIKGAVNALQEVPDTALWPDFLAAAREYAPRLYERLAPQPEGYGEGYGKGYANGYREGVVLP